MNALKTESLQNEPFYHFLCDYFRSDDFQVFRLAGDASSRKYYRVIFDSKSHVLMHWEPFIDNDDYAFLSVLNHFHKANVYVPNVLAKAPKEGLILLEDLGDLTLERRFWETANQQEILPYYKLAIDELIKIHIQASQNQDSCTAFKIEFDQEKLLWELNYAKKHYLEDFLSYQFSQQEEQIYKDACQQICSLLAREPQVICHRDYHSRNIMFKLGKVYVIDFQDARLGPKQYDLVSLLKDSYVKLSESSQESLLQYYFDSWERTTGENINTEHFFDIYKLQTIQRCFKACGSFASFYNLREDTRYLKYIKPTTQIVLEQIQELIQYSDLQKLLEKIILDNKKYQDL